MIFTQDTRNSAAPCSFVEREINPNVDQWERTAAS